MSQLIQLPDGTMNDWTQVSGDYDDFINYMKSLNLNWNSGTSHNGTGDGLLDTDWASIITSGLDPFRLANFLNHSGDVFASGNQSSTYDPDVGFNFSIWEEGKISIPLYRLANYANFRLPVYESITLLLDVFK